MLRGRVGFDCYYGGKVSWGIGLYYIFCGVEEVLLWFWVGNKDYLLF